MTTSEEKRRGMFWGMKNRVSPARIIGLKSVSKNDQRGLKSFIKDYRTDDLTIALLTRPEFRTTHLLDDNPLPIEKHAGIYGQGRVHKSESFKPYIGVDIDQPEWQETFKHEFGHYVHDLTEPKEFKTASEKEKERYAETYRKLISKQRKKEGTAVIYDVSPLYDSSAYARIRQSNPDKKVLFDKAVKEFPLTEDFLEAGYILPDGKMLDFSGKHEGGTPRLRSYDHREISRAFDAPVCGGMNGNMAMTVFESYGAIRFSAYDKSGISFDLNEGQKLSDGQRKRLVQASYLHPKDIQVTFYDKEGNVAGEYFKPHFFKSDISKIERAAEETFKKRTSPRRSKETPKVGAFLSELYPDRRNVFLSKDDPSKEFIAHIDYRNRLAVIDFIDIEPTLKGIGSKVLADFEELARREGAEKVIGLALRGSEGFWEKKGYTLKNRGEGAQFGIEKRL